jgi:outer membrane protein assembly factor BamE (lipoprotein component of BamABCDE complex)
LTDARFAVHGRAAMTVNFPVLRPSALLAAVLLASCTNPVDTHGNIPEAAKVAQIKPGSTDKAAVIQLLGSPSSVAAFDPDTWYYIGDKIQPEPAIIPDKVLQQDVLAIHFTKDGVVTSMDHRDLADAEAVVPNPNATPAPGREFTLMEQLIGNFGKFTNPTKAGSEPGQ